MAAEPVITPMAVCEACWMDTHAKWEPESMDINNKILMKLKGIEVPQKINNGAVEICVMCGSITIAGIYELKLTSEVYFYNNKDQMGFEINIEEDEG